MIHSVARFASPMIKGTFAALCCATLIASCGGRPAQDGAEEGASSAAENAAGAEVALPPRKPSPEGARVWIVAPVDGAELTSPLIIEFGIEGMELQHAGKPGDHTGHHHLLVDTGLPRMDLPIITDGNHVHFGQAQTSVELSLEPGSHTLQLLLADDLHIPHDPPVKSEIITVMVMD